MESIQKLKEKIKKTTIRSARNKILILLLAYIVLLIASLLAIDSHLDKGGYFLALVSSIILFGVGFYLLYARDVKNLQAIKEILEGIVESNQVFHPVLKQSLMNMSENDFTQLQQIEGDGLRRMHEYGEAYQKLKTAVEKISLNNSQNQKISFELVNSVQTLLEAYNVQASASSEQASSVAEITATMEELARTAAQIAENSTKVADQANNSDKASREGFGLINTVMYRIEKIDKKMDQISQKTQILGTQSKEIGKVLDIIYDIANETHLLALNAAIESVSAGEFGKRFAVIATEVRRLAEISRENAETIKKTIEEFQNSIDTTILAIDEGTKMTSEVNVTAEEISSHLNSITETVASTSQSAGEISMATQQQRTASDQIVLTLKEISSVTKQQAQELKKSSNEIKKLNSLALNHQILTQHTIIDSPLSLGKKIRALSELPEVIQMDSRELSHALSRIIDENRFIELTYIASAEGRLVAFYMNENREDTDNIMQIGKDVTSRPWYVNTISSDYPFISDIYKSLFSSEECFTVSNCIKNADGDVVGVIAIDINTRDWNKIIA